MAFMTFIHINEQGVKVTSSQYETMKWANLNIIIQILLVYRNSSLLTVFVNGEVKDCVVSFAFR